MRLFTLLIVLISTALSAQIDTALFQGENVPSYYQKIEANIDATITKKLKSQEIIALEKATLQKLRQIYAIKDTLTPFHTITLDEPIIKEQKYLDAFYLLNDLALEIKRLEEKEKDIQQKLFEVKNSIEKTLPNDNNQSLLHHQLQYAFYKISQEKINKTLPLYKKLFEKEFSTFIQALSRVSFKEKVAKTIIQHSDKKIDTIAQKNLLLTIDKDSEAQRTPQAQDMIAKKEKIIQKESDTTRLKKIKAQVLLSLKYLKERKQKVFLTRIEQIEKDILSLTPQAKLKAQNMLELLIMIGKKRFDETESAIATTSQGFHYIKHSISSIINKTLFVYEDKAFSIKTLFTFAFILFVGLLIAKLYKNFVDSFRKANRIKSLSAARLIANSGYYIIILSTFFTALAAIGLDMHTIFVVVGAILLWLALGLQGFIANYAMGILIKIDRSIRIGDHVELDEQIVGCVDDMDFRSITIQTGDQVRYIIPNSRFISGEFINHSLEENVRRLHIPFSVDKEVSHAKVEAIVLQTLAKSKVPHIRTKEKKAQVIIIDINRKITRYALLVWIEQEANHDMPVVMSVFFSQIHHAISMLDLPKYDTITPNKLLKEKIYD